MPKKDNNEKKEHVDIPDFLKPGIEQAKETSQPKETWKEEQLRKFLEAQNEEKPKDKSENSKNRKKKVKKTGQKTAFKEKRYKEEKEQEPSNELHENGLHNSSRVEKMLEPLEKRALNKQILMVAYIFTFLFLALIIYFAKFIAFDSKDLIINSYNKRQNYFTQRVVKGKILSRDGKVLASSEKEADGTYVRNYPYKNVFSHVIGYNTHGKSGLELSENYSLYSTSASVWEQVMNDIKEEKSIGNNIVTTLDTDIQNAAYQALGDNKGAVVAIEPSTGKILAMVSKPDYNPNNINDDWEELSKSKNSVLLNRATQGLYPPGSTFKILTALEYMREYPDYKNYSYICRGTSVQDGVKIHCAGYEVHNRVSLAESLAYSCNTSFVNIGSKLNFKKYRNLCEEFLFNKEIPMNFACSKSSFSLSEKSAKSDMPQTAIGQGDTLITPLENALIIATVANGGVMMKPMLVNSIEDDEGNTIKKYSPSIYKELMTTKEADEMTELLSGVVEKGTASALSGLRHTYAGKTGSAEHSDGDKTHAWFVGFSPTDNPEVAVSVIVENVGGGSRFAVPIAQEVYQAYYDKYGK